MSNCPFCNVEPTSGDANPSTGVSHRAWRAIQWLCPTALLMLTPKCPMCVVAYVALFSGVSISVSAARWIQILMPVCCLMALVCLIVNQCRRRSKARGFSVVCS